MAIIDIHSPEKLPAEATSLVLVMLRLGRTLSSMSDSACDSLLS